MKNTINKMKHTLLMFCYTDAALKELVVFIRNGFKSTPASRATYVVSLDRALDKHYASECAK